MVYMITEYKELVGKRVEVYFNLHKHVLSVREKGIVIAHLHRIALRNVKFAVSEAGRQRVLRERRKNVHALIRGEVTQDFSDIGCIATYNPYKWNSFVYKHTEYPVRAAGRVTIDGKKVMVNAI